MRKKGDMRKVLRIVHHINACIVDKCFELKLIFMFETHGEQYVMTMEITKKKE